MLIAKRGLKGKQIAKESWEITLRLTFHDPPADGNRKQFGDPAAIAAWPHDDPNGELAANLQPPRLSPDYRRSLLTAEKGIAQAAAKHRSRPSSDKR